MSDRPATERELLRWAEALSSTAMTGLGFTDNLYERERFEEVLEIAADIRSHVVGGLDPQRQVQEWLDRIGVGVAGYVTPKITVGAVVGNDHGELLMVQRADSGVWLYPTGWADVGYSPAEVVVKEVKEEAGIDCDVVRPIAVLDGQRRASPAFRSSRSCSTAGPPAANSPPIRSSAPMSAGLPRTPCPTPRPGPISGPLTRLRRSGAKTFRCCSICLAHRRGRAPPIISRGPRERSRRLRHHPRRPDPAPSPLAACR